MNVSASNMANADSVTGPDGEPYRAKQVVFRSRRRPGSRPAACALPVVDDPAPERLVYQPGNPLADAKGYVRMPNVDVVGKWSIPSPLPAATGPTSRCSTPPSR